MNVMKTRILHTRSSRKYFERIVKQLLDSAFEFNEELCRSLRAFPLLYHTQAICSHFTGQLFVLTR